MLQVPLSFDDGGEDDIYMYFGGDEEEKALFGKDGAFFEEVRALLEECTEPTIKQFTSRALMVVVMMTSP